MLVAFPGVDLVDERAWAGHRRHPGSVKQEPAAAGAGARRAELGPRKSPGLAGRPCAERLRRLTERFTRCIPELHRTSDGASAVPGLGQAALGEKVPCSARVGESRSIDTRGGSESVGTRQHRDVPATCTIFGELGPLQDARGSGAWTAPGPVRRAGALRALTGDRVLSRLSMLSRFAGLGTPPSA